MPAVSCILSKFYIKPQQRFDVDIPNPVVSYRNSTSNHNSSSSAGSSLTVVSYRNSTSNHNILILKLVSITSCILSKFYIKPQHRPDYWRPRSVVSYRNSTSNHNRESVTALVTPVVSYRNSTSNHNNVFATKLVILVVSYRNSTSNHNNAFATKLVILLYLIEILHQTTTACRLPDLF